jgi:hypothetical protein
MMQDKYLLISTCCGMPILWNCKTENEKPEGICTYCKTWSEVKKVDREWFLKR